MMRRDTLAAIDPVEGSEVERVASSPVFEELRRDIMATDPRARESELHGTASIVLHPGSRRPRLAVAFAVAAVVMVLAGLLVLGGGGNPGKEPTSVTAKTGTWKLTDDVLSGTWQQYTSGPPPGSFTCPTTSICYTMSGQYASPMAGSPLLSESLYVSTDAGATWVGSLMPQGFAPTSSIACGGASSCAAGGTDNGQSVLATTTDGGKTWTFAPLPQGVGHLDTLSCPSNTYCAGLAADSEFLQIGTTDATFLSTSDSGKTFTDKPILAGDSMQSLTCSTSLDCTAVGWNDLLGANDWTSGVAARTTDGGETWTPGSLPAGLGVNSSSQLSCADASHCSMTGTIAISVQNPPQCAGIPQPSSGGTSAKTPPSPQSPAVHAIAQAESLAEAKEVLKDAGSGGFSCNPMSQPVLIGAIASTRDGGLSWTPNPLPAAVPEPFFWGLSCPTDNQCWATGSDAVPQQVGTSHNGGSPMLLATIDGGSTWSNVTFSVPQGAPNYLGQSYLSMGSISCPSTSICVALGSGAQSAPSVPTYSLVVPGSSR
jgi:photosystem II stability/assembly factor-like uncharacterized protein